MNLARVSKPRRGIVEENVGKASALFVRSASQIGRSASAVSAVMKRRGGEETKKRKERKKKKDDRDPADDMPGLR